MPDSLLMNGGRPTGRIRLVPGWFGIPRAEKELVDAAGSTVWVQAVTPIILFASRREDGYFEINPDTTNT